MWLAVTANVLIAFFTQINALRGSDELSATYPQLLKEKEVHGRITRLPGKKHEGQLHSSPS
jgi:hypothetical protein